MAGLISGFLRGNGVTDKMPSYYDRAFLKSRIILDFKNDQQVWPNYDLACPNKALQLRP
jgi:hypothetical protein